MKDLPRLLAPSLPAFGIFAQNSSFFEKRDLTISTRDGVKQHTVVFTPSDASGPLPMLLERAPLDVLADATKKQIGIKDDHDQAPVPVLATDSHTTKPTDN
jgi:hypothetical protein